LFLRSRPNKFDRKAKKPADRLPLIVFGTPLPIAAPGAIEQVMSRSLHTQKLELRAQRRIHAPYAARREDGARLSGRASTARFAAAQPVGSARPVAIYVQRPAPGCLHPLRPAEVRDWLEQAGFAPRYGLRLIRMRHECGLQRAGMVFGEYVAPGEIHLYPVPAPPWRLPFLLSSHDLAAFVRHGAEVTADAVLRRTHVAWPGSSLRDYALLEILAHELGHHLLQHNAGKRTAQVRRREDHERFADMVSRRMAAQLQRNREGR
jgi:hypothetical protein